MKLSTLCAACGIAFSLIHLPADAAAKKKPAKKPAAVQQAPEPEIKDALATDYHCDFGNQVTIYTKADDDAHIALRWKSHLHQLTRVDTTTGADRFENAPDGLVWIGIPTKGMLLDSKGGHQLANECKNATQAAVAAGTP